MIKIIVDSTCDLPQDIMDLYDIKMLPLRISINGKEYIDKVTMQVDKVYDAMRNGFIPKTSQPSPADMYNLFGEYCIKGYNFFYLAFSSKLSGTFQTASLIIEELKEKYSQIKMEVIDSKGGSTGTGLIALQAAKLIKDGQKFEQILKSIFDLRDHVEHIFTITDLSWLIKGGRISKAAGMIGNILDVKPILDVNDGIMEVIKKVRGKKKALSAIVDIVEERIKNFPDQVIGISHADDLKTAQALIDAIKDKLGDKKVIINKIGSVLGSHLGIGGVGVFFFNKKPDFYVE
ncbi:MAG: DegV family protein [Clostridiales bacterium]|nr:DegV family protein [Clostridiales bacterium]